MLGEGHGDASGEQNDGHRKRRRRSHRFLLLDFFAGRALRARVRFRPGTPGDVMASAERIWSSNRSGSNFRSRTIARIGCPVFTDSFAISAVAPYPM